MPKGTFIGRRAPSKGPRGRPAQRFSLRLAVISLGLHLEVSSLSACLSTRSEFPFHEDSSPVGPGLTLLASL